MLFRAHNSANIIKGLEEQDKGSKDAQMTNLSPYKHKVHPFYIIYHMMNSLVHNQTFRIPYFKNESSFLTLLTPKSKFISWNPRLYHVLFIFMIIIGRQELTSQILDILRSIKILKKHKNSYNMNVSILPNLCSIFKWSND